MFKIIGVRSKLGKSIIGDAIGAFDKISAKLQDGIKHCQADCDEHQKSISESEQKIRDLGTHIERANRVVAKLKEFVA